MVVLFQGTVVYFGVTWKVTIYIYKSIPQSIPNEIIRVTGKKQAQLCRNVSGIERGCQFSDIVLHIQIR